jgi:hypothetical protein
MEAIQHSVDLLNTSLRTRMPEDVNYACMSAAGRYHQSFLANMYDQGLIIIHPGIRLPGAIDLRLLILESLLKNRGALDLSRDKQFAIDEKRGATLYQQFDPFPFQVVQRRGW